MVLDLSVTAAQAYVEDCERCCAPLEIRYRVEEGSVVEFEVEPSAA